MAPTSSKKRTTEEINIVVTGYAPWPPFRSNPSWQVANAMPRLIFRRGKPNIRIITYPDALPVSWHAVRDVVPTLWAGEKKSYGLYQDPEAPETFKIHAMVHVGLNSQSAATYSLERTAFKAEYNSPDVDGTEPDDDDRTGGGTWGDCPAKLTTDLDLERIREKIRSKLKDANVEVSDDPGQFLCGYIYYSSLALLWRKKQPRNVMFLHVPADHRNEAIVKGVDVACHLVEAIAEDIKIVTE